MVTNMIIKCVLTCLQNNKDNRSQKERNHCSLCWYNTLF